MPDQNDNLADTEELSSDQLLAAFTKGGFFKWIAIAVAAHVVFIAVFSVGSIIKRFAPQKPDAAEEAQTASEAAQPDAGAAAQEAPAASGAQAAADTPAAGAAASGGDETDAEILRQRSDSPVVKRITEAAKPEEIPDEPGDLGISLEDTQVR